MTSHNDRSTFQSERAEAREHIRRFLLAKRDGGWHQLPPGGPWSGGTFGEMFNGYDAVTERQAAKDCIRRARYHARGEWAQYVAAF